MKIDTAELERRKQKRIQIESVLDELLAKLPNKLKIEKINGNSVEIKPVGPVNDRLQTCIYELTLANEKYFVKISDTGHVEDNLAYNLAALEDRVTLTPDIIGGKVKEGGRPSYVYSIKSGRTLEQTALGNPSFLASEDATALLAYAFGCSKDAIEKYFEQKEQKLSLPDWENWENTHGSLKDTYVKFEPGYLPSAEREKLEKLCADNTATEAQRSLLKIANDMAQKLPEEHQNPKHPVSVYEDAANDFVNHIFDIVEKRFDKIIKTYETMEQKIRVLLEKDKEKPWLSDQYKKELCSRQKDCGKQIKKLEKDKRNFLEDKTKHVPLPPLTPTVSIILDPKPSNILLYGANPRYQVIFIDQVVPKANGEIDTDTIRNMCKIRGFTQFMYHLLKFEAEQDHPPGVKQLYRTVCEIMYGEYFKNKNKPIDDEMKRVIDVSEKLAYWYKTSLLKRSTATKVDQDTALCLEQITKSPAIEKYDANAA